MVDELVPWPAEGGKKERKKKKKKKKNRAWGIGSMFAPSACVGAICARPNRFATDEEQASLSLAGPSRMRERERDESDLVETGA